MRRLQIVDERVGNATASFSVDSTKSHPDFTHNRLHLLLPHPFMSLLASSDPIFSCYCYQGNKQFKKLLLSNSRQYPARSQGGREKEAERPSSLSRKHYQCLATSHGHPYPPHFQHPLSLCRKKKKKAGHEKYTVRGQLQLVIMGCLWLG